MVTEIDTGIPKRTNKRIIDELYSLQTWFFGLDINIKNIVNKQDQGFSSITMSNEQTFVANDILNSFGYLVFDIVEKNSFMKFKKINRIYWNWYHPNSVMQYHCDDVRDNYFSILYNLHDNDGGTEFHINDKTTFYKSNESEALLFPSKLLHKGVSPKINLNRFSLNIILEI